MRSTIPTRVPLLERAQASPPPGRGDRPRRPRSQVPAAVLICDRCGDVTVADTPCRCRTPHADRDRGETASPGRGSASPRGWDSTAAGSGARIRRRERCWPRPDDHRPIGNDRVANTPPPVLLPATADHLPEPLPHPRCWPSSRRSTVMFSAPRWDVRQPVKRPLSSGSRPPSPTRRAVRSPRTGAPRWLSSVP